MNQTRWMLSAGIWIFAMLIFSWHLDMFPRQSFDEFHYVPAASEWLRMAPTRNQEHPPVGKYLIAAGMFFFGENPVGWRASSVLAASGSIVFCFLIALEIFGGILLTAVCAALLSLFNFWFFVNGRVAMLDIFAVFFILGGVYFYLKAYLSEEKRKRNLYLSAIFWGFAVASKWSAVFTLLPIIGMFLIGAYQRVKAAESSRRQAIQEVAAVAGILLGSYFLTFVPYMYVSTAYRISFLEIFTYMPGRMLSLQKMVGGTHPYMSTWYSWPFMTRPIWFSYEVLKENNNFVQGIILLGNPAQMYLGILSVAYLSIKKRNKPFVAAVLALFYFSWLAWALSPRSIAFFYYFFPAATAYPFAILLAVNSIFPKNSAWRVRVAVGLVVVSAILFYYFYPLLAGVPIYKDEFMRWMWFKTWV